MLAGFCLLVSGLGGGAHVARRACVVLESERPLLENLVRGFLRCPLSMLLLFVCIAVMEKGVWRREIENRCLWVDIGYVDGVAVSVVRGTSRMNTFVTNPRTIHEIPNRKD